MESGSEDCDEKEISWPLGEQKMPMIKIRNLFTDDTESNLEIKEEPGSSDGHKENTSYLIARNMHLPYHKRIIELSLADCQALNLDETKKYFRVDDVLSKTYVTSDDTEHANNKIKTRLFTHDVIQKLFGDICRDVSSMYPDVPQRRVLERINFERGLACPCCSSNLINLKSLESHLRLTHTIGKNMYACKLCPKMSKDSRTVRKHILKAHNLLASTVFCDICNKALANLCNLNRHKARFHQSVARSYKCSLCPYAAREKGYLRKHRRFCHQTVRSCRYCSYETDSRSKLICHYRIAHKHTCRTCCVKFNSAIELFIHTSTKHAPCPMLFPCDQCDFTTGEKELQIVHINQNHRQTSSDFSCTECTMVLSNLNKLRLHLFKRHLSLIATVYQCFHCSFITPKKPFLAKHMQRAHLKNMSKEFKCSLCSYKSIQRSKLNEHFNRKHDSTPIKFYCYHCDYFSKTKAKLYQHIQMKHVQI